MFHEGLAHNARQMVAHTHPNILGSIMATTILATSTIADVTTSSAISTSPPTSTTLSEYSTYVVPTGIIYPTGQPTINNIDTVQVTYNTPWDNANLTLLCEINQELNEWALAKIDFLSSSGTYAISPIQAQMVIPHFPVYCSMMLYDFDNSSDVATGGVFTMVSTKGPVSTYAMEATYADSDVATQTASVPTESAQGPGPGPTGVIAASSATSTGLTAGSKAGIAIGITLLIVTVASLIYLDFRRRRRANREKYMVHFPSTSSTELVAPAEKPVRNPADSVAAPARTDTEPVREVKEPAPSTTEQADEVSVLSDAVAEPVHGHGQPSNGYASASPGSSAIFSSDEGRRNSEEWRQFFKKGTVQRPPYPPR